MKKLYYAHLSKFNKPKNKLQSVMATYLEDLDGRIVVDAAVFKRKLKRIVKSLNEDHSKCQPLAVDEFETLKGGKGYSFSAEWTVGLYLFPIKK